jgi:hypothetical protein
VFSPIRPIRPALAAFGTAALLVAVTPVAQAFNFGDMMNPGRWFGGGNDYYDDDYYYDGPYGPGYGYGPYGGGLGPYGAGPYGRGPYGGGLYGPGYGGPMMPPTYAAPAAPAPAAESGASNKDQEIEALKRRIEQLESGQQSAPGGGTAEGWPSAPAFRPMDQY